jgi:cytoskeleton-associated protein 5
VRDQGKRLIIESYRWIGEVMKSQLTGLKPVQLTELETEFGSLEGVGRAKPERWLRSAGPPRPEKGEGGAGGGAEGEDGADEEEDSQDSNLDPYELLDPVDILSKMPKNFYEQVQVNNGTSTGAGTSIVNT